MKYKLQIMKSVNVDVPQILTSQNDLFLYFGESAGSTTSSDSTAPGARPGEGKEEERHLTASTAGMGWEIQFLKKWDKLGEKVRLPSGKLE